MRRFGLGLMGIALLLGWAAPAASQTYTLAPAPFQTFLDNSGNIVNAGCVSTFLTGTTTRETTYSTSSGTANANPIIAGSDGRFVAFLQPGVLYRFRYENIPCSAATPGATLRTVDGIAAVGTAGTNLDLSNQTAGEALSLADLVYLSDGSGGQTAGRWYQADADNTYSSTTAVTIGFVTAAISSGAEGTIRTAGRMTGLSLSAGETYYASATAAGLTATPPTNARCVGKADTTTTLVMPCELGDVRMADSDGTHNLVVRTSSNLTADRLLTLVPGDAARTITIAGDATIGASAPMVPQGRCTLTSATPVTPADVTAATTLYYALYGGNTATFYDGTNWVQDTFAELSITMVGLTAARPYDVFIDYTAGTPALEVVAWTNATTRATALALQNGVYVQTSDTDSLYVCTIYIDAGGGAVTDSFASRHVWNYYNRVPSPMRVLPTDDTWTYSGGWRQANAAAANQLSFVIGVSEHPVTAIVQALAYEDTAGDQARVGIGLDSTSAIAAGATAVGSIAYSTASYPATLLANYVGFPDVGRRTLVWLEFADATATYYGDGGAPADRQSMMLGMGQR